MWRACGLCFVYFGKRKGVLGSPTYFPAVGTAPTEETIFQAEKHRKRNQSPRDIQSIARWLLICSWLHLINWLKGQTSSNGPFPPWCPGINHFPSLSDFLGMARLDGINWWVQTRIPTEASLFPLHLLNQNLLSTYYVSGHVLDTQKKSPLDPAFVKHTVEWWYPLLIKASQS